MIVYYDVCKYMLILSEKYVFLFIFYSFVLFIFWYVVLNWYDKWMKLFFFYVEWFVKGSSGVWV